MSDGNFIAAYEDGDVSDVVRGLLKNAEFLDAVARFFLASSGKRTHWLARMRGRNELAASFRSVTTINQLQDLIAPLLGKLIHSTSDHVFVSGLDRLEKGRPHLFISNHRDIFFDPGLINYLLHSVGMKTIRAAVGDNLFRHPEIADLLRLNKSFAVPRQATASRKLLRELRRVSQYIYGALTEEGANVWIAQREGRAKDGRDSTDPRVVKMLCLSKGKDVQIADHIASLRIVPVSISYELDPCDCEKARDLHLQNQGIYQKSEREDLLEMAKGSVGHKGRIHVAFGTLLKGRHESVASVAKEIDRQIASNFVLWPSALYASLALEGETLPVRGRAFCDRVDEARGKYRKLLLSGYANPLFLRRERIEMEAA